MHGDDIETDPVNPRILMAPIDYVCRVCGATTAIYISVEESDGEYFIDVSSKRLTRMRCERCETDRTMVADATLSEGIDDG